MTKTISKKLQNDLNWIQQNVEIMTKTILILTFHVTIMFYKVKSYIFILTFHVLIMIYITVGTL